MHALRTAATVTLFALTAATTLSGCVPLMVASAATNVALVATDRRSAGAQLDDKTIETKVAANASATWGETIHLNVNSFNGIVLLTGEAPDAATRSAIEAMVKPIDKVRSVVNEMVVAPNVPLSSSTNDTFITSKVKSRFVEANRFQINYVKVVTERQVVYLMGIVTHKEASDASEIASTTTDVVRVVRVFEYMD